MNEAQDELGDLQEELNELEAMSGKDQSSYGSPSPEKKDNMYKFFKEMINLPESWKVSNLKDEEIGKSRLGIRGLLELAEYAEAEGLELVSAYFTDKADIVAASAMGRKGFFLQTTVTNIKKEQKLKDPSEKKKSFLFGGNKNESN